MADDRDPHDVPGAPSDHSGEDVEAGLEIAGEVVERVAQVAQGVTDLAEGDAADPSVGDALGGTIEGLGAVDQIAALADADPAVRQVLGVAQQAATIAATAYEAGEALIEAGEAIARSLTGAADQDRVEYEFECSAERDAGWRVREVEIEEQLGAPYCVRLSLITEDVDALPTNLLGQDCRLRISRGDETSRSVSGLVSRVDHGQRSDRHLVTSIEIVPALDVLRHVEDSRIFQALTAVEIIDAFLGTYLGEYGRTLRIETNATYVQREYCVQYRETALDFFHRLCEEEGLTYFFDQSGEKEELVVVDDNASFAPSALLPTATDVPFVAHRGGDIAGAEPIYHFAASDRLGPTSLTVADFDWTSHTLPFSEEQRSRDAHDRGREQYLHASASTIGAYDEGDKAYKKRDIAARVQRGRERQALSTFEYRGAGAVTGFTVGTVFTLSGHPDTALDGEYLLVGVRHRGRDTHAGDAPHAQEGESTLEYENELVCIPSSVPYRPALRTRKPRISGIQSATVVGPADEEIWTDEHGRIRIQFHWDREGRNDQDSTCWVRVMQSWAGAGFGAMFIPRIDMEVVVSFVDGDPDRPIVTGCVYNAANIPPITLPDDKTQSVLRTASSPGGDGFNELRFEDKSGEERVYIHAQKDLAEDVEHDHSTHVKRNQSNTVDADQTESVGGDQTMTVTGNRTATIEKNEAVTIRQNQTTTIEKNHTELVLENETLNVGGLRDVYVGEKETETFNGGREVSVAQFDNTHVTANKNTHVQDQYNIVAGEHFKAVQGGETLLLKDEVFIESSSKAQVKSPGARLLLDGSEAKILAAGLITFESGGCKIEIGNGKVAITAPMIELQGGGSQVTLDSSGAVVAGTTRTRVSAAALVTIMGGIVSIN